jgi:hypothetical protein
MGVGEGGAPFSHLPFRLGGANGTVHQSAKLSYKFVSCLRGEGTRFAVIYLAQF